MTDLDNWLALALTDLKQRLELFGEARGYGTITITFNIKDGDTIDYQIGENLRKRLEKTMFDKSS